MLPPAPKRITVAIVDHDENDRLFMTSTVDQSPGLESVGSNQCHRNAIQHQRSAAEPEQGPLIDKPTVRNALRLLVIRMEENFHTREDLLQEALVHFWSRERQYPSQPIGWYLQDVRFYLHHLITSGHSVDSAKRRRAQAAFGDNCDGWEEWVDTLESDQDIMSEVNAHDIFTLVVDRLNPIDQSILGGMNQGLGARDIAKMLHVSHVFVVRHRRGIARVAIKLGINPVPASLTTPSSFAKSNPAKS